MGEKKPTDEQLEAELKAALKKARVEAKKLTDPSKEKKEKT